MKVPRWCFEEIREFTKSDVQKLKNLYYLLVAETRSLYEKKRC